MEFKEIYNIEKTLKLQIEELEALEILSKKISHITGNNKVKEDTNIKISEIKNIINNAAIELLDKKNRAMIYINGLEDVRVREILYYRFFKQLTWEETAKKMNYSESHVKKIYSNFKDDIK